MTDNEREKLITIGMDEHEASLRNRISGLSLAELRRMITGKKIVGGWKEDIVRERIREIEEKQRAEIEEKRHREMIEALGESTSSSNGNIVFISCGQYTEREKELGKKIVTLVETLTPFQPYFAENQSSLDGLTKNIFGKLNDAIGLIIVMHHRGKVQDSKDARIRASVWIEQEIAIAAFLEHLFEKKISIKGFVQKGIAREGVRQIIQFNPTPFEDENEILAELERELPSWRPVSPPRSAKRELHQ